MKEDLWVPEFDIINDIKLGYSSYKQLAQAISRSYCKLGVEESIYTIQQALSYWHLKFPTQSPREEIMGVLKMGEKKYGAHTWLRPDGPTSDNKSMHKSMFTHLSESFCFRTEDEESGLNPLAHLTCRALMVYTIRKRKTLGRHHD